MAGHNRWTQIKRQKEKADAAKSKIFGKFAKLITEEAKKAKGNAGASGLKTAIERARAENMPNDNIERAIKKAASGNSAQLESITYEAYGPGGVGMIIEALTSNRNKASQEIKFVLSKYGASLAGIGSVTWSFEKKEGVWTPTTTIPLSSEDIEKLVALVDELENSEEVQEIFTNAE